MLNSMSERKLYYYATQINLPQATQNITGYSGLSYLYQMFRSITEKILYVYYWSCRCNFFMFMPNDNLPLYIMFVKCIMEFTFVVTCIRTL